jgi:hypothetical protein
MATDVSSSDFKMSLSQKTLETKLNGFSSSHVITHFIMSESSVLNGITGC